MNCKLIIWFRHLINLDIVYDVQVECLNYTINVNSQSISVFDIFNPIWVCIADLGLTYNYIKCSHTFDLCCYAKYKPPSNSHTQTAKGNVRGKFK